MIKQESTSQNRVNGVLISDEVQQQFVTMMVGDHFFGISVFAVQDVLTPQKLTPIPLAPAEIVGALNLRGRIVTSISMRGRLGLPTMETELSCKSIVVEYEDRLYSLIVDTVGDVMTLPESAAVHTPENVNAEWQKIAKAVYPLEEKLLIILDVGKLLQFS